ncbi:MAG TPA: UDP-glucose 4-epimerase GalE [Kofleriaceae bacterium]|nr:UDP-glucose 4-epimerase GalE [Kofleriaceae bacterium]
MTRSGPKRLLVTGGAGYIGSVITAQLVEAGHRVTVVDDMSTGHSDAVDGAADFVEVDLLDRGQLFERLNGEWDAVVHLAARSLVAESNQHPTTYFHHNVQGAVNLLDLMRERSVPRIVFSSTAAVYGEPDQVPIDEDAPARPTSAYGASKLAVDHMLGFAARAHGIAATSLRYFNVAGAHAGRGERHAVETHLIPRVLAVAAGLGDAVDLYGTDYPTPDGTAIRDYIHVADLGRAHLLALETPAGEHHIYNLGNGEGFSVLEVLETARRVTGHPIPARPRPRRPGDPARLIAASERARRELGWSPERSGLADMVGDAWAFMARSDGGDGP